MAKLILALVVILAICINRTNAARILAVLPLFGRSHHVVFQPILKTLARAGHQVVVYSPFPLDTPHDNYTDVHLKSIPTNGSEIDELFVQMIAQPSFRCFEDSQFGYDMYNLFIKDEEIKKLLVSDEKFDLIISEVFTAQEFTMILSHIFNAPTIALQAFQTYCILNREAGNALSVAYMPDVCHPFSTRMTLRERFYNSFWVFRNLYNYYVNFLPKLEEMMRKQFPDMPPLQDLLNNVSLTFINGHRAAFYPEPLPPNIIPVGGIHLAPPQPLPQDLKTFLDESLEGVIFFSLGTYIPDELMPQKYFDTYINVFKKLPQRILWKTRRQTIQGLPSNVKLIKWAPQQDVLAHPNCVLFVTHGGQLSQIEAMYNGVPVIGIPYVFDQHRNAKFYEEAEIGLQLNLHDLTSATIFEAIQTVLKTPKYKENMKRLSIVFKDMPMSPEDTIVFWTEYVLRHGGAQHLKPVSALMPWYQLALLDVLAVIFSGAMFLIVMFYIILSKIVFKFGNRTNHCALSKKLK